MNQANKLTQVPETMLITLWAKATENNHPKPLLKDPKAAEIISKIDYDFSKFKKASFSQAGVCIRASLIDKQAAAFIKAHPDAVVIQLGAGLDARYERLQCPEVTHWYDLDLPEVIALRKQCFTETDRYSFLAMSLFDDAWMHLITAFHKPILVIVEGVLMYFDRQQVQAFFKKLCQELSQPTTIVMDILAYSLVGHAKNHDSLGAMQKNDRPEFKWSEKESQLIEQWHPYLHLDKEYFMSDYNQGRYPFIFRVLYKLPYFYKRFNQRVVQFSIVKR